MAYYNTTPPQGWVKLYNIRIGGYFLGNPNVAGGKDVLIGQKGL